MTAEEQQGLLRDAYEQLVALRGEVGQLVSALSHQAQTLVDHESRLRASERWRYALPASLVIAVASAVGVLMGR